VGWPFEDELGVNAKGGDDIVSLDGTFDDKVEVTGGSGAEIITVSGDCDGTKIVGGSVDDELYGGEGDDILDGGAGSDTALCSGDYNEFCIIIEEDGSVSITHNDGDEGADTLTNGELIQFSDETLLAADILDADRDFNYAPSFRATANSM
jgi:Ca2+-binding RTX toxin-like protein